MAGWIFDTRTSFASLSIPSRVEDVRRLHLITEHTKRMRQLAEEKARACCEQGQPLPVDVRSTLEKWTEEILTRAAKARDS